MSKANPASRAWERITARYALRAALPVAAVAARPGRKSSLDLGKIRHGARCFADLVQEPEPVLAPVGHLDIDDDLGEEGVDPRGERGDRVQRRRKILARHRLCGRLLGHMDAG